MKLQAIKFNEGILWVSDEEIKIGDWITDGKYIEKAITSKYIVCKKIIAQSNLSLEDIPYIEQFDRKVYTEEECEMAFNEGYNLCLSKHFKLLKGKIHPDEIPFYCEPMDFNEYKNSLNIQSNPISCELENYSFKDTSKGYSLKKINNLNIETYKNLQGQKCLKVKNFNYE